MYGSKKIKGFLFNGSHFFLEEGREIERLKRAEKVGVATVKGWEESKRDP